MAEVYGNLVIVVILVMEGVDRAASSSVRPSPDGLVETYVGGRIVANRIKSFSKVL